MYAGLDEWPEPPIDGDEIATLIGSLERQRATFAWKSGGLDAATAGLGRHVGVSLGGLLRHLAFVENYYFSVRLLVGNLHRHSVRSIGTPNRTGIGRGLPVTHRRRSMTCGRATSTRRDDRSPRRSLRVVSIS